MPILDSFTLTEAPKPKGRTMKTLLERLRGNTPAVLALATIPVAMVLAGVSYFSSPKYEDPNNISRAVSSRSSNSSQWSSLEQREGPPDRPDREQRRERRKGDRRDGRHHGPPPPPPVPVTVIFLIGGGLGYLIGSRRRGRCGPGRGYGPQHFRPDDYPPGHPAHYAGTPQGFAPQGPAED